MAAKTAFVGTLGCPENGMDALSLKLYLKEIGVAVVNDPSMADVIFINPCGGTTRSIKRSINAIKSLQKTARTGGEVVVWGCLPKIYPGLVREIHSGPMYGSADFREIADEVMGASKPASQIEVHNFEPPFLGRRNILNAPYRLIFPMILRQYLGAHSGMCCIRNGDPSIFFIRASTGCSANCSYCAIRLSRGTIKSKSIESIMDEFRQGLALGFKEFTLSGTDLAFQGRDLGYTLADLLLEMVKEDGDYKIGIRHVNPRYLKQMLQPFELIMSTGRIWLIEIPAQSGSNRILKAMRRGYTADDVLQCVETLRSAHPNVVLRSDMIVGFPGEKAEDHNESMIFLDKAQFDFVKVYKYSPLIGTPAAEMKDQVSSMTAYYRWWRMVIKTQVKGIRTMISRHRNV